MITLHSSSVVTRAAVSQATAGVIGVIAVILTAIRATTVLVSSTAHFTLLLRLLLQEELQDKSNFSAQKPKGNNNSNKFLDILCLHSQKALLDRLCCEVVFQVLLELLLLSLLLLMLLGSK